MEYGEVESGGAAVGCGFWRFGVWIEMVEFVEGIVSLFYMYFFGEVHRGRTDMRRF